ncbi:MAG: T9SS type A sorting domain-containing protein [Ignavibacteriales bacterium]|nr:T9SS type A sorting domain-containing protein [Ignavibacteriales bacterium]
MKILFFFITLFTFGYVNIFPQEFDEVVLQDKEPRKFFLKSHNPNFKSFPEKSFYKQKADWQYIIDTTWGQGLPLAQKQQIFNTFANSVGNSFDGFNSLGMSIADWDSLRNYYYSKIDSTTSRGRFSAIMNYLCGALRDGHTYCDDIEVFNTPLNPGVPFFMFTGNPRNIEHFGAVTTILPDSSVMILRVVDNHPLNLEPGDIILGYEGIPWKDLIIELLEAELPNYDTWGGYEGTYIDHLFIGAGMNWHLFDTIDILKYSTGDTVHLSVAPLASMNVTAMLNNEQMEITNIPFPNYFNDEVVTYGILDNTNIGYIYVFSTGPSSADAQFNQAVFALQNTDALIIDMRWNEGGSGQYHPAFEILTNETFYTIKSALRCNTFNTDLCPWNDQEIFKIRGTAPTKYDRPIALLLGPNCISDGEMNANRFIYLYNLRTFGKPTWGSLGVSDYPSVTGWYMRHSAGDKFHINNPGVYLNRAKFPIDFPVWHNRDDVAQGKDAVVEKALDWINNLVYPHSTYTDKFTYAPSEDTVHLSTIIENPNSHQLSAIAYLKTVEGDVIDSVDLVKQKLNIEGEQWSADINLPSVEELYKISITSFDQTTSAHFTVPNATRFTTAGPVVLDSISYTDGFGSSFNLKLFVLNQGVTRTITNAYIKLICNDSWYIHYNPDAVNLPDIQPGEVVISPQLSVGFVDSLFPGYFNIKVEVRSDGWTYWSDSMQVIVTGVEEKTTLPTEFALEQNYPNPFNPSTIISWQSPVSSWQTLKVYDVLGNEVVTLVNEYKTAGMYNVEFTIDNLQLSSGVYFYQLKAGSYIETKKMLLLK